MEIGVTNFVIEIIKLFPPLKERKSSWLGLFIGFFLGGVGVKIVGIMVYLASGEKQTDWLSIAGQITFYDALFGFGAMALSFYFKSIGDFVFIWIISWILYWAVPGQSTMFFAIFSGFYGMLRSLLSNKQIDEAIPFKKMNKVIVITEKGKPGRLGKSRLEISNAKGKPPRTKVLNGKPPSTVIKIDKSQ